MLSVTLLITMTTRSPPVCSVLAMRKGALMPARSGCVSVDVFCCTNWCVWFVCGFLIRAITSIISYCVCVCVYFDSSGALFLPIIWKLMCAQCILLIVWSSVIAFLLSWISVYACLKWMVIMNCYNHHIICVFRETAAVLLWQTTACLRTVGIVC